MKKHIRAETSLSIIVAILLFSTIVLIHTKWQLQHNHENAHLFQRQQALQLIENQISLQLANKVCEHQIIQNGITFEITCLPQQIEVRFPTGKIVIGNSN